MTTEQEPDLPDDPMMRTLTDALRAGPDSPEWRRAVEAVRDPATPPMSDEHRLLITARERLESGKSYREVRPGPGFTRTVMSRIDADESSRKPRRLTAGFLAYVVAALIVGVVGVIVLHLVTAAGVGGGQDLTALQLDRTIDSLKLDGPLPAGWRTFGALPVDPAHGLEPSLASPVKETSGGGIVSASLRSYSDAFAVEAVFQFKKVGPELVPQLFVTDSPDFGPGAATTPHELVWLVQGGESHVALPDGKMVDDSVRLSDNTTLTVKIVVGTADAAVFLDNKLLWTGPNELTGKQRYVGVRLIRKEGTRPPKDSVVVQSVKVTAK